MKIVPLEDRVLVKPAEATEVSKGGIHIPQGSVEKPLTGKVVAVGKGRVLESGQQWPTTVKKGDVVLYSQFGGVDVMVNDVQHKIFKEGELLGIVKENK